MNVEKKWSLAIGTLLVAAALLTGSAFASASDAVTTEVQEVQQILAEQNDDDVAAEENDAQSDEECEKEGKGGSKRHRGGKHGKGDKGGFREKERDTVVPEREPEQDAPAPSDVGGK